MKDQHILITGAAGGIGFVTAELMLQHGANVTLHYNKSLNQVQSLIDRYPNNTLLQSVSATDEHMIESTINTAVSKFGVINVLICNHAVSNDADIPIWSMSSQQFKSTLDINLVAYWMYAKYWSRQLKHYVDTHQLNDHDKQSMNACALFVGSTGMSYCILYY